MHVGAVVAPSDGDTAPNSTTLQLPLVALPGNRAPSVNLAGAGTLANVSLLQWAVVHGSGASIRVVLDDEDSIADADAWTVPAGQELSVLRPLSLVQFTASLESEPRDSVCLGSLPTSFEGVSVQQSSCSLVTLEGSIAAMQAFLRWNLLEFTHRSASASSAVLLSATMHDNFPGLGSLLSE